jgi:alkylhydroperoxidase family enzyme
MPWIKVIEPEDATGELKREYDAAVERAGKVFNILKVQSLNAGVLRASMGLYLATMHGPSGLPRADREMLATVVSWANRCFY